MTVIRTLFVVSAALQLLQIVGAGLNFPPVRSVGPSPSNLTAKFVFTCANNASSQQCIRGWYTGDSGQFHSQGWPTKVYLADTRYRWRITAPEGTFIDLKFNDNLDVWGFGKNCTSGDAIMIRAPSLTSGFGDTCSTRDRDNWVRLCDANKDSTSFLVRDNHAAVDFCTNSRGQGLGFNVVWKVVKATPPLQGAHDDSCGHGQRSRYGTGCVCDRDYGGKQCNVRCVQGTVFSGRFAESCSCYSHWTGDACEIPICENGRVVSTGNEWQPYKCDCKYTSFTGDFCEDKCENGYVITGSSSGVRQCKCYDGYFGRKCSESCDNGYFKDGVCRCYEGYWGYTCSRKDSERSSSSNWSLESTWTTVIWMVVVVVVVLVVASFAAWVGVSRQRLRRRQLERERHVRRIVSSQGVSGNGGLTQAGYTNSAFMGSFSDAEAIHMPVMPLPCYEDALKLPVYDSGKPVGPINTVSSQAAAPSAPLAPIHAAGAARSPSASTGGDHSSTTGNHGNLSAPVSEATTGSTGTTSAVTGFTNAN